jgi:hypothetical protein
MSGYPQSSKGTVVSVGANPELLSLRAQVLQSAGYQVFSTTVPQKADFRMGTGDCGVLLLCYSVSVDWRKRLIENFRARCPKGRIVAITNLPLTETPKDVDELVYGIEGPEVLIDALERKVA